MNITRRAFLGAGIAVAAASTTPMRVAAAKPSVTVYKSPT